MINYLTSGVYLFMIHDKGLRSTKSWIGFWAEDIFSFCIMLLSWYTASDRIEIWKSILADSDEAKRKQIKTNSPLGEISD